MFTEGGKQWWVGGSSFVCLVALVKSMWFILKTLSCFGRHIRYVWFDSNLLQRVSVAVVQISVRKVFWSSFRLQYFEFVIVTRKYFFVTAVRFLLISLRRDSGSFCIAM